MSTLLIPFSLLAGIIVLFAYAWLQCRAEQQQDKGQPPADTRFAFSRTFLLIFDVEWATSEYGKRLTVAINHRQLVVEIGGIGGDIITLWHERRCTGCSEWRTPDSFVLSVWGRETCASCAEYAAWDFFQVNEHYGRPDDLPAAGAWIPEYLMQEYEDHFRNVVW